MSADATLLPSNATAWERANSTVSTRLLAVPVALIQKERDPVQCDAQFVAPLAWERSIHFWRPGDDAGNRARVASSFDDHLGYGAPAALEAEIALDTGYVIAIREFWEVAGLVWPDFAVFALINPGDPAPNMDPIVASALRRKPVRDVLDHVGVIASQPPAPTCSGAACGMLAAAMVLPVAGFPKQAYFGAATGIMATAQILPFSGTKP